MQTRQRSIVCLFAKVFAQDGTHEDVNECEGLTGYRFPRFRGNGGVGVLSVLAYYHSQMLLFKKKFLEQIRRGEKTQTIRLWDHRRMKSGQRSYIPGVGYIAIVGVEPVELTQLTDADAVLDGFPTAELLRDEIRSLYATETLKKLTPFRIRFSVYPPREQKRIAKERQREKQKQRDDLHRNRDTRQQEFVAQTLDKLQKMSEHKTESEQ